MYARAYKIPRLSALRTQVLIFENACRWYCLPLSARPTGRQRPCGGASCAIAPRVSIRFELASLAALCWPWHSLGMAFCTAVVQGEACFFPDPRPPADIGASIRRTV